MKKLIYIFLLFSIGLQAQQLAFPDAFGAAAYTGGFRNGVVLKVTSLADGTANDVGTLRWAIQNTTNKALNRIVVFDVSGVIELQSDIYASNAPGDEGGYTGSIYIAGQTAPLGGITITGGRIRLTEWNDIVIRYVKFRNDGGNDGTLHIRAYNEIVDHCSFSHVTNSTATSMASMQYGDLSKGTFSNNLLGQNSYAFILGESTPDPARQLQDGSFTVIRNAYYNCGWRTPFKGGSAIKVDAFNNIAHNWSNRLIRMDGWPYKLNHEENYYQAGGNTTNTLLWCSYLNNTNLPQIFTDNNFLEDDPRGNFSIPVGYDVDEANAWTEFQNNFVKLPSSYFLNTRHPISGRVFDIYPNNVLKDSILPNVGASKYLDNNGNPQSYRDTYDISFVTGIQNNDASTRNSTLALPIVTLSNTRPVNFDTDNDGMADAWEVREFGDLSQDNNGDFDSDGWTNIEEYLNQVDSEVVTPLVNVTSVQGLPETLTLTVGQSYDFTEEVLPANANDKSVVWSRSNTSFATIDQNGLVTATSPGTVTITATTNDGGFTDSTVVTVTASGNGNGNGGNLSKKLKLILISN